jgi:hypothetical protein
VARAITATVFLFLVSIPNALGQVKLHCNPPLGIHSLVLKEIGENHTIGPHRTFTIHGQYTQADWNLLLDTEAQNKEPNSIALKEDFTFSKEIELSLATTFIEFIAVGPSGEIERVACSIVKKDRTSPNALELDPKNFWEISQSQTYSAYSETRNRSVSQFSFTGTTSYRRPIPGTVWTVGGSVFGTLLPVLHAPGNALTARFFGVNLRAIFGWSDQQRWYPGGFRIFAGSGWYYWSMFVRDSSYGIRYAYGPQIYLMGRKPTSLGRLQLYLKFAPLSSGGIPTFSNSELAIGASHTIPKSFRFDLLPNSTAINLDLSTLNLTGSATNGTVTMKTASLGVSVEI